MSFCPAPTPAPTTAPTAAPTPAPTAAPTPALAAHYNPFVVMVDDDTCTREPVEDPCELCDSTFPHKDRASNLKQCKETLCDKES